MSVFGTLAAEEPFPDEIAAVLVEYCYDCHGDGMSKGGVAFDAFESDFLSLYQRKATDFAFSRTLEPMESSRDHVQIMGGLDHKNAEGGKDGAGDHARGNGVFLTGVRLNKSSTDIQCGISIDQVIANQVGHLTRFPSLELTCDRKRQSSGCDSGYSCAYQYNIAWRSETTPMTPEANPRLVFERLFGPGNHGERAGNARRRLHDRRSLLDFVMGDARDMQRRLGLRDKEKLDQYLTSVRDIEKRIQQAEAFGPPPDPDLPTPAGLPDTQSEYVQLMYDMMISAFQTDSTRVATFVLGHDGDNASGACRAETGEHRDLETRGESMDPGEERNTQKDPGESAINHARPRKHS